MNILCVLQFCKKKKKIAVVCIDDFICTRMILKKQFKDKTKIEGICII